MANKTTNYNLTKPLPEEFYDIAVHNGNMDIIDAELKRLAGASGNVTPAGIGAVAKAGDTMTGRLTLPSMLIKDSIMDAYFITEGSSAKLQIVARDSRYNTEGMFIITPDGLFFMDATSGYEYRILHTGNTPAAVATAELV